MSTPHQEIREKLEKEFLHKFVNTHNMEWRPLRGLWHEEILEFFFTEIEAAEKRGYEKGVSKVQLPWAEILTRSEIARIKQKEWDEGFLAGQRSMIEQVKEKIKEMDSLEGRFDGSADTDHIKGYRIALNELKSSLQTLEDNLK